MKLETLIHDMTQTEQTPGQNVLQHGKAVNDRFLDLYCLLSGSGSKPRYAWRFPSWFT